MCFQHGIFFSTERQKDRVSSWVISTTVINIISLNRWRVWLRNIRNSRFFFFLSHSFDSSASRYWDIGFTNCTCVISSGCSSHPPKYFQGRYCWNDRLLCRKKRDKNGCTQQNDAMPPYLLGAHRVVVVLDDKWDRLEFQSIDTLLSLVIHHHHHTI